MAEAEDVIVIDDDDDVHVIESTDEDTLECPICLQPCVHPTKLPCGHIFCFLCIKGTAYKNNKCALCRRKIPLKCLNNPKLVVKRDELSRTQNDYQWFYEGRNGGWWEYEQRTSEEIENAFNSKQKEIEILICGTIYIINLNDMIQYPKDSRHRSRKIKREKKVNVRIKGVAGIPLM